MQNKLEVSNLDIASVFRDYFYLPNKDRTTSVKTARSIYKALLWWSVFEESLLIFMNTFNKYTMKIHKAQKMWPAVHLVFVLLVYWAVCSQQETCTDLNFYPHRNDVLYVNENDFVNLTFWFNVSACNQTNIVHKVTVHTKTTTGIEYDGAVTYNNGKCTGRQSIQCITPTGPATLYKQVNRSHLLIELEFSSPPSDDLISLQKKLNVLYPPDVTSLTVNGSEVSGNYLIDEFQEVSISCTFDPGNPPGKFFLFDKTGNEIKATRGEDYLNLSLTLRCEHDWPTVRCEGSGSKTNKSVSFLVRCAELKFTHLGENITSISVNKFVSVTFALNVSACDLPRRLYTIKVGTRTIAGSLEYDGSITFFETSRCSETLNTSVRCTTPAGPAELYREVNRSHVQIEWKWQWKNLQSSRYLNNQKELKLNVLYPPSVTSLTMNGLEVNGDHLIDEGEINISCSFDQGNPHSNFLLLSEQGKEMNALRAEKYLNGSLLISCHLDWPTIRCEGNGSNVNRSVSLLVRCCPQFKSKYPKVTTNKTHENWTFHVRSHAKEIKNCLLTPMSLKENASKDVNCTLIGDPPEMLLTVALDKEDIEKERKWALKFSNERGFSDPLVFRIVSRMKSC
ncbi:uncharacterized protein LOC112567849 isoform X2 [Pomacea canaliculata]|uniref:uncharacterized protein LOC112567849 isoform X2 n=1 Tax=Pomacea canaliculata TaxID=400727 RepID=UPI000D73F259|nr:uncharacterized protein LOC112567849 isoform X2 [Pomacea canaliculata]